MDCRNSCVGVDGSFMLFYSPRKSASVADMKKKKKTDPVVRELVETIQSMGLDTTSKQVQQGLIELYPDGTDGVAQGLVIRELFRYLKSE